MGSKPRPQRIVSPLALRPKQAAKALGIGERKLWEITRLNQIPHIKLGACVLYPLAELEKWLSSISVKEVD